MRPVATCKKCGQQMESGSGPLEVVFCPSCSRKRKGPAECERCGKRKRIEGRDDTGLAVCRRCMGESKRERGWICPRCHQRDVPYFSHSRCRHCYENERDRREIDRFAARFETERERQLFREFAEDLKRTSGRSGVADRLARYAGFFASLEKGWDETSKLPIPFLRKVFGDGLWTVWHRPMAFLTRRGLVNGYEGPVDDGPGGLKGTKAGGPRRECAECRKVKNSVTHRDERGRLVCGVCIVVLHRESCERSGQVEVHHHSGETCPGCARAERVTRKLGQRLRSVQWQECFSGFGIWVTARQGPDVSSKTILRHIDFFVELERVAADPGMLTLEDLAEVLTRGDFYYRRLPLSYLIEKKIIPGGDDDFDKAITDTMRRRLLKKASTRWYGEILKGYDDMLKDLVEAKKINCWRAISYLSVAERFVNELDAKGIASVQEIRQKHYRDLFATQRHKLRNFVRYLVEYVPGCPKLRLEKIAWRSARFDLSLDESAQRDILERYLAPPDRLLKMAVIVLLMLLCAQSLKKTVRLKLGDLVLGVDGIYRFGPVGVPLGKEFSSVITRYLAQRTSAALLSRGSDYLFPGATIRGHLTAKRAGINLKRLGIPYRKLYSSAIARYFQQGNTERVFLTQAYGVPPSTARWYEETFLAAAAGQLS